MCACVQACAYTVLTQYTCGGQGTTFRVLSFHHGSCKNNTHVIKLGSKYLYSLNHLACSKYLLLKAAFWTLLNILTFIFLLIQCQKSKSTRKFLILLAILRNVNKCFKGHYSICWTILFHSVVTYIMIYMLSQCESTHGLVLKSCSAFLMVPVSTGLK